MTNDISSDLSSDVPQAPSASSASSSVITDDILDRVFEAVQRIRKIPEKPYHPIPHPQVSGYWILFPCSNIRGKKLVLVPDIRRP